MGFPSSGGAELAGGLQVPFTSEQVQRGWTNMPAAVTDFQNKTGCRFRGNLTPFNRVRLLASVQAVAGVAGSVLRGQYSTDNSIWNDLTPNLAIDVLGFRDTGWADIPAGAKADDIYIRVVGQNGDAVVDPNFTDVSLVFDI